MVDINWGLIAPALQSNPGQALTSAFEQGATRSALGRLSTNRNDAHAMNVLMQFNPEVGMQMQDRARQQAAAELAAQQAQLEHYRQDITIGARILRQHAPTDQASWDRARSAFAMAGVSPDTLAHVPTQFDPNYANDILTAAGPATPVDVAPNHTLIDPNTHAPVYRAPGEDYTLGENATRLDGNNNVVGRGVTSVQAIPVQPGGRVATVQRGSPWGAGSAAAPISAPQAETAPPMPVGLSGGPPPVSPGHTPETLRSEAARAIERGADPAAVAQRLQADLQALSQGGASPSNGSGPFPGTNLSLNGDPAAAANLANWNRR